MAGAAMTETLDQISAAIPRFGFPAVFSKRPGFKEQAVPEHHAPALAEIENCCRPVCTHGRECPQVA